MNEAQKAALYDRLRYEHADWTHEQAVSEVERQDAAASSQPGNASLTTQRPDVLDQTIRDPSGSPKGELGAALAGGKAVASYGAGAFVGGLIGSMLAKGASPIVARNFLTRAIGSALAGIGGGAASRATNEALSKNRDFSNTFNPKYMALDAALGGGISLLGSGVAGMGTMLGANKNMIAAKNSTATMKELAHRLGKTPEEVAAMIRGASGRDLSVIDMHPQFQQLGVDAAARSPVAEQQLEQFVRAREGEPVTGAIDDLQRATKTTGGNLRTQAESMRDAISQADQARFGPIWQQFNRPITDPATVKQVNAILKVLPGIQKTLVDEQVIKMEPVDDVLTTLPNGDASVTLRGLHRIKTILDKSISVGENAKASKTLSSDEAMKLGTFKRARTQLMSVLQRPTVPGVPEYASALQASQADRQVLSALLKGAEMTKSKATAGDVADEFAALQNAQRPADAQQAFRQGMAGSVTLAAERKPGVLNAMVRNRDLKAKLGQIATSPAENAAREASLSDRIAVRQTNAMQKARRPPSFGDNEAVPLSGTFGLSSAAGSVLVGNPSGATGGLARMVGSAVPSAVTRARNAATAKSFEDMVSMLTERPGASAADKYLELLKSLDRAKRTRAGWNVALSGGLAGLLSPNPDSPDQQP